MLLPRSYSFAGESRWAVFPLFVLLFSCSPLHFYSLSFCSARSGQRDAFLLRLLLSFELLFPHNWSLSYSHVFILPSWCHVSWLMPLCGQESLRGKPKGIVPTQLLIFPHTDLQLPCLPFLCLQHRRGQAQETVLVDRNLWILSESHQEDNCPLPGNPNPLYTWYFPFPFIPFSAHITATRGN